MWKLVFAGDLATGFERREVIARLARLLDQSQDQVVRELFPGQAVVVAQVNTEEEAHQRREDFANAGALLIVLPADESAPGGSRYAGADPANVNIEEPTPASVFARLPAVRRRNQALMVLGAIALVLAVFLILVALVRA